MNKKIMISIMLLLVSFSLVVANVDFNNDEITIINDLVKENSILKQENLKLKMSLIDYLDKSILREEGFIYIRVPSGMDLRNVFPPIVKHSHSTTTVTETEYIQCEECESKPICTPYYFKYVDDGVDSCGCAINPRCVKDNHQEIEEIPKFI